MTNYIHAEINAQTGETTQRPYTAEEIAALEEINARIAQQKADEIAKESARQAILDRLGLTSDEAKLLLGGN